MSARTRGFVFPAIAAAWAIVQPCAPAQATDWPVWISKDPVRVATERKATSGTASMHGGCNRLLGPGFYVTLRDYRGDRLSRLDQVSRPVFFAVKRADGSEQAYRAKMHYVGFEKAWVLTDPLPAQFYEEFGRGKSLVIINERDEPVVEFDLTGGEKLAAALGSGCPK